MLLASKGTPRHSSEILEAVVEEAALSGSKDMHMTCHRQIQKVSLTLEDFFEDQIMQTDQLVEETSREETEMVKADKEQFIGSNPGQSTS